MVAPAEGAFDSVRKEALKATVVDRLRQGPGPEAQQAVTATPDGPPPSRWSLRGIQATFPWWAELTLSGVWRALHHLGLDCARRRCNSIVPTPTT
jgi:hypothetical protein